MSQYKKKLKNTLIRIQGTEQSIDTAILILNDGVSTNALSEFSVRDVKSYLKGYKNAIKNLKGELNEVIWNNGDDKEEPPEDEDTETAE